MLYKNVVEKSEKIIKENEWKLFMKERIKNLDNQWPWSWGFHETLMFEKELRRRHR